MDYREPIHRDSDERTRHDQQNHSESTHRRTLGFARRRFSYPRGIRLTLLSAVGQALGRMCNARSSPNELLQAASDPDGRIVVHARYVQHHSRPR